MCTTISSSSVFENHGLRLIIIFTIPNHMAQIHLDAHEKRKQHNKPRSSWADIELWGYISSFSSHLTIPKYNALYIDAHQSHAHCQRNEDSGNARRHVCMGGWSGKCPPTRCAETRACRVPTPERVFRDGRSHGSWKARDRNRHHPLPSW